MKKLVQLIIADDDNKVRSAIHLLLDQDRACWQVVSEVKDLGELIDSVQKNKPQLLLLDWELPQKIDVGDIAAKVTLIKMLNPLLHIIALSSKPQARNEAMLCGVDAFVAKTDPPEIFLSALYQICDQESRYLHV